MSYICLAKRSTGPGFGVSLVSLKTTPSQRECEGLGVDTERAISHMNAEAPPAPKCSTRGCNSVAAIALRGPLTLATMCQWPAYRRARGGLKCFR